MTTYSSEQVINKAAGDLGKWVPGEALGEVEYATLSDSLDAVLAEIGKIIAISDRDEVPDFAYETVSSMVAAYAASSFSGAPLDYANVVFPLEQRLRYLVAQAPSYQILRSNYF